MKLHAIPWPDAAHFSWQGEVDGVRDHVGEVVQFQALSWEGAFVETTAPALRSQPHQYMLVGLDGKWRSR